MNEKNDPKEHTLFKAIFQHIKLLTSNKVNLRPPPKKMLASQTARDSVNTDNICLSISSADKIFHINRSLPRKALQQLKKGQYNLEDTIDLHGMSVANAKTVLDQFIQESYQANFFVVGVIHGKGRNNTDKPILKNKINEWLRDYSNVIAFCSAPNKDGGTGKVYVMLERSR